MKVLVALLVVAPLLTGTALAQEARQPTTDTLLLVPYHQVVEGTDFVVVRFSELANTDATTEARIFGSGRDEDLVSLRTAVRGNPTAMQLLATGGFDVEVVVAMQSLPGGQVILYVNDWQ